MKVKSITLSVHSLALRAVALAACALAPVTAFATSIPFPADGGILQIGNLAGVLVGVTSVPACINWGGGTTCASATHSMNVSGSSTVFAFPSTGTLRDISTYPPPGSPLVDFETVTGSAAVGGATIHFDLMSVPVNLITTGICSGPGANAPGNICNPAGSPFSIQEDITGTQVSINFSTVMQAYTGTSATGVTPYIGIFSTQLSGTIVGSGSCSGIGATITNILTCQGTGGTITATWAGTESPLLVINPNEPVPEPGSTSLAFVGGALLVISAASRRRQKP